MAETEKKTTVGKIEEARARSPKYPQISLPDALERVKAIYAGLHTSRASERRILELLGFKAKSGTTQGIISALKKYGLLEGRQDSFSVSRDAVTLLERQPDHPDYEHAVMRAAYAPPLFEEIQEHFNGKVFSDEDLRVYLINRSFSRRAVDQLIRAYRDTMALVAASPSEYNAATMQQPKEQQRSAAVTSPEVHRLFGAKIPRAEEPRIRQGAMDAPLGPNEQDLKINVGPERQVRIIFDGPITREAAEMISAILDVQKRVFRKESEVMERARAATWRNKDVDQPVTVIGDAGVAADGRIYVRISGSDTAIPEDEITYVK